jgi:aryl-alcohol dehydrogenase-like predicted oxidoreductase
MKLRALQIGDQKVPPIGQGCMGVGGRFSKNTAHDAEQIAALRLGIDLGMTFIDTAEGYGKGHSEEIVGEAVGPMRDDVFLASKVSPENLTAAALTLACENSLRRLKTDRIDLYQIHWPNPTIPLEETLGGLIRLREAGKIRHIGVSNFSIEELRRTRFILGSIPLSSVQTEYNIFERGPEKDIIPWCAEEGVLFISYSPLDQGRLVGNKKVRQRLNELADASGCTDAQLALVFLGSRGPVVSIPKAVRNKHICENAGAMSLSVSDEIIARVSADCLVQVEMVPWQQIQPVPDKSGEHSVYTSIESARRNLAGHSPSPQDLAMEILKNDRIKPIRVVPISSEDSGFKYELAEGRLRFWAWVLAFNGERGVPVLVRDYKKEEMVEA